MIIEQMSLKVKMIREKQFLNITKAKRISSGSPTPAVERWNN